MRLPSRDEPHPFGYVAGRAGRPYRVPGLAEAAQDALLTWVRRMNAADVDLFAALGSAAPPLIEVTSERPMWVCSPPSPPQALCQGAGGTGTTSRHVFSHPWAILGQGSRGAFPWTTRR